MKMIVTEADVEAIEKAAGIGNGAWEVIDPKNLILAVMFHYEVDTMVTMLSDCTMEQLHPSFRKSIEDIIRRFRAA